MPLNTIIHLSDAALIAVHALAGLASSPDRLIQSKELAEAIGASGNHLAKVMQRLVKAGLVRSVKGPSGGFGLAKNADAISFKAAIEAVDGPLGSNFCPFSTEHCNPGNCIFGKEISSHAHQLIDYLGQRSIGDIARQGGSITPALA
ncbi:MAG TPA: Rrf2 family transcriptional regulator [Spirochaetales bacterium]|nr:Rrf2 family transcriptional regulator [Spirochaetales bacterium]